MAGEKGFDPIFRIYPAGIEFEATYTESSYEESFSNKDCTVVVDSDGVECYEYQIVTSNPGSLVITANGKDYSIETYFGGPQYWNIVLNNTKPEQLYAYTEEGIGMYAWTIEDGCKVNPSSCNTIYTKTPILDITNGVFYDENGVEYNIFSGYDVEINSSTYFMTNTQVTEATAEKITMSASDPV